MKRILVLSSYWPTQANSISGIFVAQQAAALVRQGCHLTVVVEKPIGRVVDRILSPSELDLPAERVRLHEVPVLRLPQNLLGWPGALRMNVSLVGHATRREVARLARTEGSFDACIVHGARYFAWTAGAWRHLVSGQTCVVLHGVDPFLERAHLRPRIRAQFASSSRHVDAYVLVGTPLRAHLHTIGVPPDRSEIIHNGTALPPAGAVHDGQRPLTETRKIVSVSNLIPIKGIDLNIRALAQVREQHPDLRWSYTVIGDGPERATLERLVRQLRLEDRVGFAGRLDYGETMAQVQDADLVSVPSWGEAFGIVYLEAMARMRPTIGCLGNGAEEVISDAQDGMLVRPQDVSDLREALSSLLQDPARCQAIGRAARRKAEAFTWDRNAARFLAALDLRKESMP